MRAATGTADHPVPRDRSLAVTLSDPKTILLAALLVVTAVFVSLWARASWRHLGIGLITDFLDTLGIGSFATTTTLFRLRKLVADEKIPGTLNVGHALPTVVQALIYITIVEVDFTTLVLLIVAAIAGSWIGAAIVAGLPRGTIQRGMGVALLVAAVLMIMTALDRFPGGGTDIGLSGGKLVAAIGINFALGALMTLGIGLYAPCMIMVSLLGMNPTAAFPIMMGSCAFLMPIAGYQFIRKQKYDVRAAMGLAMGGIPGVLVAALIVRNLPLDWVRWLVVVVVVYAATSLLRSSTQRNPLPASHPV
jgi:uncharacterized membrane protein YfcA